jgi:hypothetical protein
MKTNKLAIAALVAVMFPVMSFADVSMNAALSSNDQVHPETSDEGVPQWVLDASKNERNSIKTIPLKKVDLELGTNVSANSAMSSLQTKAKGQDQLVLLDEVFGEADAIAADDVVAFINDRIRVDLTSKTSQFEEVDQYNAEIKRIELRSELAKQEMEVIKSQLEIKRLRDELKIDLTRDDVKEKVLVVYNKKVRELKTENNRALDDLQSKLALEMNNKVEELNLLISEKDSIIAKNIKDSAASIKAIEGTIVDIQKSHEGLMNDMVLEMNHLNFVIGQLEDKISIFEAKDLEGVIFSDDVALAKIKGREGNLRAKIHFESEIIEVRMGDDILNSGNVFVKEITPEYLVLHFTDEGIDSTFYPMGDARAATYVYNQMVKKHNEKAVANYQKQLEKEAEDQLPGADDYLQESNTTNSSNGIQMMPSPPQSTDLDITVQEMNTLYNAYGESIASGFDS